MAERGAMWALLALACLSPPGSAETPRPLSPDVGTMAPGALLRAPGTASALPARSEDPVLSLNLGLNFKIKVRSQGSYRPAVPSAEPPPPDPAPPGLWTELPPGSGWLGADDPEDGAGGWDSSEALEPTAQLWAAARAVPRGAGLATPAGAGRERSKELEFKIDIDLTAGLDQERGAPPTSLLRQQAPGTRWRYPLLPSLRAGISEIASQLGASGFFSPTLAPDGHLGLEGNSTTGAWDLAPDGSPTPARATEPGLQPSGHSPSPGSAGAMAGDPLETPEPCSSPEPPAAPASPPLLVGLHADWNTALAAWGPAWEAHVYGAGALFGLLALLALLGLAGLPFRCPVGAGLLAPLDLLLLGAGAARATLLFSEAYGQHERLPAAATRVLRDLPFPCLAGALGTACLLLSLRPRAKPPRSGAGRPGALAILLLLHFSVAVAAAVLPGIPLLRLASRGLFAVLAALLSLAFLAVYGLARAEATQVHGLAGAPVPAGHCPFANGHEWRRAARAVVPAATCGLLSAGLQGYAVLHTLGYGLPPATFGPWPWWGLQLGCRLAEAGLGLPLAVLALGRGAPRGRCWAKLLGLSTSKAPALPAPAPWAQREKLGVCDTVARAGPEGLPLCPLPAEATSVLSLPLDGGDPTADFRPPSPIDLGRSIAEALCSSPSLFQPALGTPPVPETPGVWPAGGSRCSTPRYGLSRAGSCQALCSSPEAPASPARDPGPFRGLAGMGDARCSPSPPGGPYRPLPPPSLESLPRGCQSDQLSVGSDTIDL